MTTPDPTRSKAIEVIVGALCAGTTCDRDCADVDHRPCDDAFCAWQKDAERILAHLQAEGMAVVPVEATIAMEDAGQEIIGSCYVNEKMADPANIWSVMLSASPSMKAGKEESNG